jgi:hypothetical protein
VLCEVTHADPRSPKRGRDDQNYPDCGRDEANQFEIAVDGASAIRGSLYLMIPLGYYGSGDSTIRIFILRETHEHRLSYRTRHHFWRKARFKMQQGAKRIGALHVCEKSMRSCRLAS